MSAFCKPAFRPVCRVYDVGEIDGQLFITME